MASVLYHVPTVFLQVHVAVMSVTLAATIIAFILIFSHVKAWSKVSTLIPRTLSRMHCFLKCQYTYQDKRFHTGVNKTNSPIRFHEFFYDTLFIVLLTNIKAKISDRHLYLRDMHDKYNIEVDTILVEW